MAASKSDLDIDPYHSIVSSELERLIRQAVAFAAKSKSENTLSIYHRDWTAFAKWCEQFEIAALPATPAGVAAYVVSLAESGYRAATIERKLVSISQAHKLRGVAPPTAHPQVRTVLKGIRRKIGTAQTRKTALSVKQLKAIICQLPDSVQGTRDRAILLLGFLGGFRRSELVGLNVNDIDFVPEGLVVVIRTSKTDQESHGRIVGIPRSEDKRFDPVDALSEWLDRSGIVKDAVFRPVNRYDQVHGKRLVARAIARIVKRSVNSIGLDESEFAGHSLRSGLATSAAHAGVSERVISNTTGHKSREVLSRYIRSGALFDENPAKGLL